MSDKSRKERAALLFKLRQVLISRTDTAAADQVRLRDAVCEFVFSEQRRGASLTAMIDTVNEILSTSQKSATKASVTRVASATSVNLLGRQLVEWCVEFHRSGGPLIPIGPGMVS